MADYKGVLIFSELAQGKMMPLAAELLGIGRRLADELGEGVSAALLGSGVGDVAKELIAFGADKVYVVDDPLLEEYQNDAYTTVLEKICKEINPSIVLLGQTLVGRDIAPILSFKLETGLANDCVELSIDPETKAMLQTRPVYGGAARATVVCETARPQIATVRPKAMNPLERDDSRTGEIIALEAGLEPSMLRTRVVEVKKEQAEGIRLEDAEVVISGGRGLGSSEPFKQLEDLAKILGGVVGASRAACDSGYAPPSYQVGLTGKVVNPNLYVAIAISGASQHMAGCSGAKNIVAINKDPEANIFKEARFGVEGDWKQVLPSFIDMCRELIG